ncbi:unnamed protein product [Pleuronectes platessa]|uniref:BEN domain-containing protein n=1 Tax=Pleuronectes platessa TaxID=8262 RepID=A0A9N7TJ82_PLEPL|nr:unnamed protein product [Pleuronectes platessa]
MVEKLAWAYAVNANSATVVVRHLLTAVFPVEILLVSNLRGGKRGRGDARLPLDKSKLDAIYSATLERWPGTQPSSIGSTIHAKITELRAKRYIYVLNLAYAKPLHFTFEVLQKIIMQLEQQDHSRCSGSTSTGTAEAPLASGCGKYAKGLRTATLASKDKCENPVV